MPPSQELSLYAVLDKKTRRRVLCALASKGCRGELATIAELPPGAAGTHRLGDERRVFLAWSERSDEPPNRIVAFTLGWIKGSEGVWRYSKRFAQNEQRGKHDQFRRRPRFLNHSVQGVNMLGTALNEPGEPTTFTPAHGLPEPSSHHAFTQYESQYPARALCPQCDREQILDWERLELHGRIIASKHSAL